MNEAHAHILLFICLSALGPACKRALEGILERESSHQDPATATAKASFTIILLCASGGGYLMVSSFLLISGEDTNTPRMAPWQRFGCVETV